MLGLVIEAERIGEGRTAEIFAHGPGQVIKLLRLGFDPAILEVEARKTLAATEVGAPAPAPHGPDTVQRRPGWVYDRIDGTLMIDEILRHPRRSGDLADVLAGVHADVHDRPGSLELPAVKERLAEKIEHAAPLGAARRDLALSQLSRLPDGDRLLHGDFHPGNVMLGTGGPYVIDWLDAARGHPGADVARTLWLGSRAAAGPRSTHKVRAAARRTRERYLRRYLAITGMSADAVRGWRLPVIAGRLSEGIEHETAPILKEIDRILKGR